MKSKSFQFLLLTALATGLAGCGGASVSGVGTPSTTVTGYRQVNLVAVSGGVANHTDPGLVNPRGIAIAPGEAFWIAEHSRGQARVYDASGAAQPPAGVSIPNLGGSSASTPTAVLFNPIADDFHVSGNPSQLLFATEDGTISGWARDIAGDLPTSATLALDQSSAGAEYTGMAIATPACCREFLAVADFNNGTVETFNIGFSLLAPPGSFTDTNLPAGYAPFGIQVVGGQVFITYALQDSNRRNPVAGAGNGLVDVFDLEGNFVKRFASNGALNAPWAVVKAGSNFGPFSNAVLIGNFGDGTIQAFEAATGTMLGSLKDASGRTITNPGLWALVFGANGIGDPNTLYFTAGAGTGHGLFGAISSATN